MARTRAMSLQDSVSAGTGVISMLHSDRLSTQWIRRRAEDAL